MTCPRCHNDVGEDDKYCSQCGFYLLSPCSVYNFQPNDFEKKDVAPGNDSDAKAPAEYMVVNYHTEYFEHIFSSGEKVESNRDLEAYLAEQERRGWRFVSITALSGEFRCCYKLVFRKKKRGEG